MTPARRTALAAAWSGVFTFSGIGLSDPKWFILVSVASPIIAIATFAALSERRNVEELRRGWSIGYRIATVGLVLAGIAGVLATAGRLAGTDAPWFANGPLALLFLLAFLTGWPALAKPSPRRGALPAMVIHISWLPLLVANWVMDDRWLHDEEDSWLQVVGSVSLPSILACSAFAAVLSLVAFHGEPRIAAARATARM